MKELKLLHKKSKNMRDRITKINLLYFFIDISKFQVPKPKIPIGKFSEIKLIDFIYLKSVGEKSLISYIPVIFTTNKNIIKKSKKIITLK